MIVGLKRFMVGLYGGTADEHLDEPLLMLCVAFSLLSLEISMDYLLNRCVDSEPPDILYL